MAGRFGRLCTAVFSLSLVVAASLSTGSADGATHGHTSIILTTRNSPTMGAYLASGHGFTLYTFTLDTSHSSACTGACARLWPPLLAPKGAKLNRLVRGVPASRLGTIGRANGAHQLTYEGKPLYLFAGDKRPGQTTGEGVDNVWFVALVRPVKTASTDPTPTPSTAATSPPAQPDSSSSTRSHSTTAPAGGSPATAPPPTSAPVPPPTTQPAPPPTTQPPAPPTTTQPPTGGYGY